RSKRSGSRAARAGKRITPKAHAGAERGTPHSLHISSTSGCNCSRRLMARSGGLETPAFAPLVGAKRTLISVVDFLVHAPVLPEFRKPIRRKRPISCPRLQIAMPEIMRERAGILALVGELVPRRMSQHVGMDWEWELSGSAGALDHPQEPRRCDRSTSFGDEDVRARSS